MKIGVFGGGMTGLSAAITLAECGHSVALFEKNKFLGGLAGAFKYNDYWLDYNYRHIFRQDTEAISWIEKYGHELSWLPSRMGYYTKNKIYPFGKPHDLLFFTPLSFWGRFRFALGTLKIKYQQDFWPLEKETAEHYLIRNSGQEVFDTIWKPLLLAKFGQEYKKISAIWIWGKIALRGKSRDKSGFQELLGYMPGSFLKLINSMEQDLIKLGARIHLNSEILQIKNRQNGGFKVALLGSSRMLEEEEFDYILSAVPLPEFISIAKPLSEQEKYTWNKIKFTAASTLILVLKKRFSNIYWLNIGDRNIPFGGIIEHTNFVSPKSYNNQHIVYISHYMFENDRFFGLKKDKLLDEYLPHLCKINPNFSQDDIIEVFGGQGKYAQPLIETNYGSIKPNYHTTCKGLFHAGMAHIYPEDRGINYALKVGKEAALTLLEKLSG